MKRGITLITIILFGLFNVDTATCIHLVEIVECFRDEVYIFLLDVTYKL